jgi:hypothetical protein
LTRPGWRKRGTMFSDYGVMMRCVRSDHTATVSNINTTVSCALYCFLPERCIYYAPRKISGEHIVIGLSVRPSVRAQHLGRYLEGQGHSMTLQQNRVRPITSLFEVRFCNYFTEMITILRQCVMHNIWVVFTLWTLSVQPALVLLKSIYIYFIQDRSANSSQFWLDFVLVYLICLWYTLY